MPVLSILHQASPEGAIAKASIFSEGRYLEADLVFGHWPGWPHTERTLHALSSLPAHRSHVCRLRRSGHALAEQARLARNHDHPSTDRRRAARRHSCVGVVGKPPTTTKCPVQMLSRSAVRGNRAGAARLLPPSSITPRVRSRKRRCLTTRWCSGMSPCSTSRTSSGEPAEQQILPAESAARNSTS